MKKMFIIMIMALMPKIAAMETKTEGDPRLWRAIMDDNVAAVEKLVKDPKVDVDGTYSAAHGGTALHIAIEFNKPNKILMALLTMPSKKVNVDAKDADGDTPLHKAAGSKNTEAVKALVKYRANTLAKNNNGETPQDVAKKHGFLNLYNKAVKEASVK